VVWSTLTLHGSLWQPHRCESVRPPAAGRGNRAYDVGFCVRTAEDREAIPGADKGPISVQDGRPSETEYGVGLYCGVRSTCH
jgi:hypothetical protein